MPTKKLSSSGNDHKKVSTKQAKERVQKFKEEFPDLYKWLAELLGTKESIEKNVNVFFDQPRKGEHTVRLHLFTKDHRYSVSARRSEHGPMKSYLGCTVVSRKPRAGEDWNRGRDLHDGELNPWTWIWILQDMLRYELVRVMFHPEEPTTR